MSTTKNHIDIDILKTIIANGDYEQLKKLMIHLGSMNVKYRILSIIKILDEVDFKCGLDTMLSDMLSDMFIDELSAILNINQRYMGTNLGDKPEELVELIMVEYNTKNYDLF
jgi:hypothetical protein